MRKYQKKKLLEIIGAIGEAHEEIIKAFTCNQTETAIHILSECQESAVNIIDFIEESEGEKANAVIAPFEDYYKLLYEISGQANNPHIVKIAKMLKRQLIKIETTVKTELKADKFEALFLPYKASMWDSLESIWLAAKEDPNCHAVVMPIPYYEKHSDGALGQMRYEGNLYPEYVPIINWEEYNIEESRPDIIFIHNPYDNFNVVTQVHSDFFCERLREFTDMLVYVPYFVCLDDVLTEFCVLPGTVYANKVIVQSNRVRKTYISEYHKSGKPQNQKDMLRKAEEKFVALGSPKFDKVLNTKPDDCRIPEEWRDLIEMSDGSRKKVVLYNTTLGALLAGSKSALPKLKYVFEQFKGRNDVVLLWRPHPLSITTYGTMLSELLKEYLKLIDDYKLEGWGIYDDSADINRAIAVSDAYYGDRSSLVPLYQCTGKPIMIQNFNIVSENENLKRLIFPDLYDDGKNFLLASRDFNGWFKMDKQTWDVEYMSCFPNEELNGWFLFRAIYHYENKIYFGPMSANEIAVYNINEQTFSTIPLSCPAIKIKTQYNPMFKFCSVVKYNRYLFFIASTFPAFIRHDLVNGETEYFYDWVQPLNKLVTEPYDSYFRANPVVNGSSFTVAACNANAVVVFDMESCTSEVYKVGDNTRRYLAICFDGKDYWMAPRHDGPVTRWNLETGEYREYAFPEEYESCINGFVNICYASGYIWLFPDQAKAAFKINVTDGVVTVASEFQPECENEYMDKHLLNANYLQAKIINGNIYALTGKTRQLIEYSPETGYRREQPILLPPEIEEKIQSYAFHKNVYLCKQSPDCYFYENDFTSLRGFLGHITQYAEERNMKLLSDKQIELFHNEVSQANGLSGTSIFSHCTESLAAFEM